MVVSPAPLKDVLLKAGALALLAVVIFTTRYSFITVPLERDEGVYSYIAWRMNYGEMPYTDIFDHKPPGIYLIYKVAYDLFGYHFVSIRFFTIFYVILIMLAVFLLARRVSGGRAGYIAAGIYSLYQSSVLLRGIGSNAEIFMSLPVLLSAYFFAGKGKNSYWEAAFSGVLLAAAVFIKQMAVFLIPAYVLFAIIRKIKIKKMIYFFSGFILIAALVAAWLYLNGALRDFVESGVLFNYFYLKSVNETFLSERAMAAAGNFFSESWMLLLAAAWFAYVAVREKSGYAVFLLLFAILFLFFSIAALGWKRPHYYLAVYPLLCVSAGAAVNSLYMSVKRAWRHVIVFAVMCALVAVFACRNALFYGMPPALVSHAQYNKTEFVDSLIMSGVINTLKEEGSTLFVWTANPEIYFYTKIRCRFRLISVTTDYFSYDPEGVAEVLIKAGQNRPDFFVLGGKKGKNRVINRILGGYRLMFSSGNKELYGKAPARAGR